MIKIHEWTEFANAMGLAVFLLFYFMVSYTVNGMA